MYEQFCLRLKAMQEGVLWMIWEKLNRTLNQGGGSGLKCWEKRTPQDWELCVRRLTRVKNRSFCVLKNVRRGAHVCSDHHLRWWQGWRWSRGKLASGWREGNGLISRRLKNVCLGCSWTRKRFQAHADVDINAEPPTKEEIGHGV